MSAVWHPFTQHATEAEPLMITKTEGSILTVNDGSTLIDAVSSWWVTTHGHRYPPIMEAIRKATEKLDQIIFAGLTHEPAEALAAQLVKRAPKGLTKVFFSDSGSTSVEVALKMALGYWVHNDRPRHRIVVMESSYHGDTIGTMSVGERGVFNAPYQPLMFGVDRIPFPEGDGQNAVRAFDALCASGDIAAVILEPLVLGAGGMRMYSPEVLAQLAKTARDHGVLLILDEVMTGWGRTGRFWACDHAGVSPDIMCTSKGLTGGTMPLAATLATDAVFDAHYSEDRRKTFYHSSSYTANPIACAAALANCLVWDNEDVMGRITRIGELQQQHLDSLQGLDGFENPRRCGTIAAVDLAADGGYLSDAGQQLRAVARRNGVLLRPLGSAVYVMPPYCTTPEQLEKIWDIIRNFRPE